VEHPTDDSPRPSAQSTRDTPVQCVVVQDVANGATSADGATRDANGRRWPAGPARARLSTVATPAVASARAGGQIAESADSHAPGRSPDGAGPEFRTASPGAMTPRLESQQRSARRQTSRVAWPATKPTSNDFGWTRYWQGTGGAGQVLSREIHDPRRKPGVLRGADAVEEGGRLHLPCRQREIRQDPARSETLCTHRHISHGNREVPHLSPAEGAGDRIGKSKDTRR
jgi:hypothetical protein